MDGHDSPKRTSPAGEGQTKSLPASGGAQSEAVRWGGERAAGVLSAEQCARISCLGCLKRFSSQAA